jgi:iron(III) transport system ATP-binding protein
MSSKNSDLVITNLSLKYDDKFVISDINFEIDDSEILALVGPSGSGKTSLIRCITGLQEPNKGEIEISGNPIFSEEVNIPIEKRDIGIVFQDFALFPHMTVEDNISYGMKNDNNKNSKSLTQLSSITDLMLMTGIYHLRERYPDELSGGEQQRVALARSLAPKPKLLLMDEPFSNLDPNLRMQLRMEVRRILKYLKISCLFVTHDQQEALYMGDRILVLNKGEIQQLDDKIQVFQNPSNEFVAEFIGLADFIDGQIIDNFAKTELGQIEVKSKARNGENVNIMVRPDDVNITKNNKGNGFVVSREYRGMYYIYNVKLNSGKLIKSLASHISDFNVGTKVDVQLKPGHPLICFKDKVII